MTKAAPSGKQPSERGPSSAPAWLAAVVLAVASLGMLYASLSRGAPSKPSAAPDRLVTIDAADRPHVEQARPLVRSPLIQERPPAGVEAESSGDEPKAEQPSQRVEEVLPIEGAGVTPPPESGAPVGEAPASGAPAARSPRLIDINSATQAQLELLPRIGPALAQRIIEERTRNGPFRSLSDLERVRGIGEKTVEALSPYAECKQPR